MEELVKRLVSEMVDNGNTSTNKEYVVVNEIEKNKNNTTKQLNSDELSHLISQLVERKLFLQGCDTEQIDTYLKAMKGIKVPTIENEIKVRRVDRTRHILEEALAFVDAYFEGADIDSTIKVIEYLDRELPGKKYFIEVSDVENKMPYSDEFIENILKEKFIEYFKR